ncbi:hypothetical protein DXN04_17170 [Chitinophaga silvisoli]|uniref:Uncharacterized protein n=1 Tax=Chitinophaga silvisoli TaxID=2291814 RepID=A0A3E1P0G8_9BACT|nr:hypothetical protein DXN04_17170 [Chitinophaga silvisoli]
MVIVYKVQLIWFCSIREGKNLFVEGCVKKSYSAGYNKTLCERGARRYFTNNKRPFLVVGSIIQRHFAAGNIPFRVEYKKALLFMAKVL